MGESTELKAQAELCFGKKMSLFIQQVLIECLLNTPDTKPWPRGAYMR